MSKSALDKLGWKPGIAAHVVARPEELDAVPDERAEMPELVLAFVRSVADVAPRLGEALPLYRRGGRLWFAYPKKTGAIRTDINRDQGWEPLREAELVAVTQVAIDDTWSALRFRYRDEVAKLTRKGEQA
ncbi:hypothetical protein [Sphingomonas lenta]|uniref:DUF3052 domain-containing protein n=1 Tax=Sphingomonas lenta TaxID=1141887 RepID=A0A2A2SD25_9SPHN|nr:hypothetical protein [Sphingomonas lenta]PAX07082.1 hypothetical protein CKY28_13615 [Sphingomonas lenta]